MKNRSTDVFANKAYGSVLESAANTLTFGAFNTGIPLFEKRAWIIHQIWYGMTRASINNLVDAADIITFGVTTSNQITALGTDNASLVDSVILTPAIFGAAASGTIFRLPVVSDFCNFPGGGLIVPPTNLYVAVVGTSCVAVNSISCRIWYTEKLLAESEYWELVEATRIIR